MRTATAHQHAFIGRERELQQLRRIARLNKASLVVCRGRLGIGKTRLIERFAQNVEHFYAFQGLSPGEDSDQRVHFARQISRQFEQGIHPGSWHEAFTVLARLSEGRLSQGQRALIFLDEISWMASRDKDFVGQLKIAWDTRLKKNPRLILVLCGSVSSWIDRNILHSADFMGRVSLSLDLRELPLDKCNQLFSAVGGGSGERMSPQEKTRILCVTGGVPRYLEEIDYSVTAESNVVDLCFTRGGLLVDEFDKIFNDIFAARAATYRQLVCTLIDGARTFTEICEQLGSDPNGIYTEYLEDLEAAGFVHRDYVYSLDTGNRRKLSRYRLKDNYLRFYLKDIEPLRDRIESETLSSEEIPEFSQFDSIMGLQFENLVLNNLPLVLKALEVKQLRSASPYFQNKTLRQPSCQIDLLIDSQYAVYLCEMKMRARVSASIVKEVNDKARLLKIDPEKSLRRVLIYRGKLDPGIEASGAFDHLVPFERFLLPAGARNAT